MENILRNLELIAGNAPWLKDFFVLFVVNPQAGGFTNPLEHSRHSKDIEDFADDFLFNRTTVGNYTTVFTVRKPGDFTAELSEFEKKSEQKKTFIISLGGDGLASEVSCALAAADRSFQERTILFAAPMGTGNDGSGAPNMHLACKIIAYGPIHGRFTRARLINIAMANRQEAVAYNVASLGIDAFVAHAANIFKKRIPGNFYKLMVSVAALFYDFFYRTYKSSVKAILPDGSPYAFTRKLLLFCVGYRGGARYGGGKTVIPDNENVCALGYMGIFKRIIYKNRIAEGRHRNLKETDLFTSDYLEYHYNGKILLNIDGEISKLNAENFPLTFTIRETNVRVIKLNTHEDSGRAADHETA
jgi:diacylglycerol kinase family enzyme